MPAQGVVFAPLTINGVYEEWLPAAIKLYADPYFSFPTGSALYNHYAGDAVELTIHALSSYRYAPPTHVSRQSAGGGRWLVHLK